MTDMELVLASECDHPGECRPAYLCHWAREEVSRRAVDGRAVRRRIALAAARLRELPDEDLALVAVDSDPEGLWRLAMREELRRAREGGGAP
jgi:hypothetical protein